MFLNLVWLSLSIVLAAEYVLSSRRQGSRRDGRTLVAVCLLIVLLLPAISMTDDLLAMSSPADVEHLMRHELPLIQATSIASLLALPLGAAAESALATLCVISARIWPFTFAARVLAGHARSHGVRGPSFLATI